MSATIIGQNHTVISYELNGRKRHIVEDMAKTVNRRLVNDAVEQVGREWSAVYNYIDEWLSNPHCSGYVDGLELADDTSLCNTIESMTY